MRFRARGSVLAVVLAGFAVRALAFAWTHDAPLVLDEQSYLARAQALIEGRGFLGSYQSWVLHQGRPIDLPQYPGAWQPPGQTVWLAAAMRAGGGIDAARFSQVLLGTLIVALVYALGRAWFGHRSGLAAAWLCALYPNLIAFSHYLWSEPLFIALTLGALWLLTRAGELPGTAATAGAGLLLGLCALTRAAGLVFAVLCAGWLAWAHRERWGPALQRSALMLAICGLVILPWCVRNTQLHGGLVLIDTNGPYNFWRGNGPDSFTDRGAAALPHYGWPFDSLPVAPVGNRTARRLVEEARGALGTPTPTDLEVIGHARDAAWAEIRAHPGTFLARIPVRLWDLWNPTSFLVRHLESGVYGPMSPGLAGSLTLAAMLGYLLVMGLGIAGACIARRREVWLVLLLAAELSALSAVAFGLTRFRLPLMPLLMVLAGPVLVRLKRPPAAATLAAAVLLLGCDARPVPHGPNVLWVVWDTVRADHLSLHGHPRETTPRLDAWAAGARVFDDAISPAGYTLPAHASMFTGLLPSEHCTHNGHQELDARFPTVAELLRDAGYRTFLFSANPHVSDLAGSGLDQGFQAAAHPWSPRWEPRARAIVEEKVVAEDRSSELAARLAAERAGGGTAVTPWNIKAAGGVARQATLEWLEQGDPERPFFVFLNYMEAHRPTIPAADYRALWMDPEQVAQSYRVDRSWLAMWEYNFGLREYSARELDLTRRTYDATLRELDDLFAELLAALGERGHLRDTVVILTSDHGEHLGEHHMLDHQYSLHQVLLHVPLVIHYPARVAPGRSDRPASTVDLFTTVLDLAGVAAPESSRPGRSLLEAAGGSLRLAEEPSPSTVGIAQVLAAHPNFDPEPYRRRMRALFDGPLKYIWSSNGRHALYDLADDPGELHDRAAEGSEALARMRERLALVERALVPCQEGDGGPAKLDPQQCQMLIGLGYLEPDAECAP